MPSINIRSVCVSVIDNQPQDSKLKDTVTIIISATGNQIVKSFGVRFSALKVQSRLRVFGYPSACS